MKYLILLLIMLLAGCSHAPSGSYASAETDGRILRNSDGQPFITLFFENGETWIRKAGDGDRVRGRVKYRFADDILYIPSGNADIALKVDGDMLLPVSKEASDFPAFKKL